MAMIEIDQVSYDYPVDGHPVHVLKDVSFAIEPGEFVAIQGPSGSGKSTLLYLIGGLLKLTSGAIRLQGMDITQLNADDLALFRNRNVGFIFQQFHLLPRTSVLKNILLPNFYPFEFDRRVPDVARARDLAEKLGLGQRLEHMPNQLSGGQQQRVAIARALMNDAKIILADEPTGNLDSKSSEQTMQLLKDLNAQGLTIVLITHDREIAQQCHKIFHFKDGNIERVEMLAKSKVLKDPPRLQKPLHALPGYFSLLIRLLPLCFENLFRNGIRSLLTMLGVTIGIAAVVAMLTLGQFTKTKILDSYQEMGINTLFFRGFPNWDLKATDSPPVFF